MQLVKHKDTEAGRVTDVFKWQVSTNFEFTKQ